MLAGMLAFEVAQRARSGTDSSVREQTDTGL
jgi:hypothetical protein